MPPSPPHAGPAHAAPAPSPYTRYRPHLAFRSASRAPVASIVVDYPKACPPATPGACGGAEYGLGLDVDDAIVRISLVHYNTVEEVQKIIAILDEVLA